MAAVPSVCSEAMNNSHTCGQPDTQKHKELCNAEAHTEGRGQDGAYVCVCHACVGDGGFLCNFCPQYRKPSVGYNHRLHGLIQFDPHLSVCLPLPAAQESGGKLESWSSPLIGFLYICSISSPPILCFIPPHLPVFSSHFLLHSL